MEANNYQSLVERPRPTLLAATAMMLLAAAGLWIASLAAPAIRVKSPALQTTLVNLLYYVPFFLIPMAAYALRHPGLSASLRLNPMPALSTLSVIFLAMMSVYVASALDSLWTLMLNVLGLKALEVDLELEGSRSVVLAVLHTAALPAVFEELMFRGFGMAAWESRGTKLAAWVTSVLFMLLHGNLFGMPAYLLVGGVSAYLVFSLDSLYAGIIYHTVYNTTILVLNYLLSRGEAAEPAVTPNLVFSIALEAIIIGALMASVLFSLEFRRRLTGKVEPIPRLRQPLRTSEKAALGLLIAAMLATTVVVAAGVQA